MDLRPVLIALTVGCALDPATGPTTSLPTTEPLTTGAECVEDALRTGDPWQGTTSGGQDRVRATCGGAGAPDASVSYVKEGKAGGAAFIVTADFDAVLRVADACSGVELACADEPGPGGEFIGLQLDAGQAVVVTVDGYQGASGAFTVDTIDGDYDEPICDDGEDNDNDGLIDCEDPACADAAPCLPMCPMQILDPVVPGLASTTGKLNQFAPSCVKDSSAPDVSFEFTPLETRSYTFRTLGSTFDTVLSVLASCDGETLACNDDDAKSTLGNDRSSVVTLDLEKGQSVVVVVDGYEANQGDVFLSVD